MSGQCPLLDESSFPRSPSGLVQCEPTQALSLWRAGEISSWGRYPPAREHPTGWRRAHGSILNSHAWERNHRPPWVPPAHTLRWGRTSTHPLPPCLAALRSCSRRELPSAVSEGGGTPSPGSIYNFGRLKAHVRPQHMQDRGAHPQWAGSTSHTPQLGVTELSLRLPRFSTADTPA